MTVGTPAPASTTTPTTTTEGETAVDSGWHPDPSRQHELRYWDGSRWTEHVVDRGVQSVSPLPAPPAAGGGPGAGGQGVPTAGSYGQSAARSQTGSDPVGSRATSGSHAAAESSSSSSQAGVAEHVLPPQGQVPVEHASGPGTAGQAAPSSPAAGPSQAPSQGPSQGPTLGPPQGQPLPQSFPGQAQGQVQGQSFGAGAPFGQPGPGSGPQGQPGRPGGHGGIVGDLVDGRFAGGEAPGPALQNSKLLRVRLTEPFLAKQGAMVAYQGELAFHYQGAGMGRVLKRALTGEGLALMRVEGRGDCFLADRAKSVHLLHLENSGISVNGANVLAFSQSLEWNVERVKGAAMATGGLFNTTLRGSGWLAIVTDGDPVVLDAGYAPTFADTDAIVAWSADLQTSLHSTLSAGALIGRGSGEAVQVVFQGRGFVIVQPSETIRTPARA